MPRKESKDTLKSLSSGSLLDSVMTVIQEGMDMNERITTLEHAAQILETARREALRVSNEIGWKIANRAYNRIMEQLAEFAA